MTITSIHLLQSLYFLILPNTQLDDGKGSQYNNAHVDIEEMETVTDTINAKTRIYIGGLSIEQERQLYTLTF